uniref:DUF834 domain-containing protein n=1 Tax=Oryza rufipogon TaxID=4529 RepID=A0A0E0QJV7_ORYRU
MELDMDMASRRVGMRSPTTGARTRGSAATGVTGVDGVGFGDGGGGDVEEVGDGDGGGVEWWGAAEHEVGVARPRGGGGGDVLGGLARNGEEADGDGIGENKVAENKAAVNGSQVHNVVLCGSTSG